MSFKYKMFLLVLVAMAPLWAFGNQKYTSSKHHTGDLAAQVQSELSTAAPNAVVVVVDRATRTAYVTGNSANQADVDQVKQALQRMTGIRVIATASHTSDMTGSMSSNTHIRTYRSNSQPSANTRSMDASSMGSTNGINHDNDYTTEPPRTGMGPGTGSATPTDGSMNPSMNHGDSDMRTNSAAATQTNSPDNTSNDATTAGSASTAGGSAAGTKTGSATNGTVSDASLTQSVKDSFDKEGLMGQNKVVVETRNGIVSLTGIALSQDQADRMVALARQVSGVTGVNNNLQIQK